MSFTKPEAPPPLPAVPAAPAPPPMFGQSKPGAKPGRKSMQPTFLGEAAQAQPGQLGQKTLLGQ